jgi:ribosome modulation factor
MQKGTQVKLIHIARRRLDGLIDPHWVEGFEAYKAQRSPNNCPYTTDTEEFSSWVEGWMDAHKAHSPERQ